MKHKFIAALDINLSAIVCLICDILDSGKIKILARIRKSSGGIDVNGKITNIKEFQYRILSAISEAENIAGVNVDDVVVNFDFESLKSNLIEISVNFKKNKRINKNIRAKLTEQAIEYFYQKSKDRQIIDTIPMQYIIDDIYSIRDIVGVVGQKVIAKIYVISVNKKSLFNLGNFITNCRLNIKQYVPSFYSALICYLTEEEKQVGSLFVHFGFHQTNFAIFTQGEIVHIGSIPLGKIHIIRDVVQKFSISFDSAVKLQYNYNDINHNNVIYVHKDNIQTKSNNYDDNEIDVAVLNEVVKARIAEILILLKEKITAVSSNIIISRIIIDASLSSNTSIINAAERIFDLNVRFASFNKDIIEDVNIDNEHYINSIGMAMRYASDNVVFTHSAKKSGGFIAAIAKLRGY